MRKAQWLCAVCFLFAAGSFSQPKDWVVTVASGRTYADVRCEKLIDDFISLRRSKTDRDTLGLDSVVAVSRERRGSIIFGAATGVLAGGLLGGFLGGKASSSGSDWDLGAVAGAFNGMMIGAVVGGVVGGVIMANVDDDKYFDLSQMTLDEKRVLLKNEVINK